MSCPMKNFQVGKLTLDPRDLAILKCLPSEGIANEVHSISPLWRPEELRLEEATQPDPGNPTPECMAGIAEAAERGDLGHRRT